MKKKTRFLRLILLGLGILTLAACAGVDSRSDVTAPSQAVAEVAPGLLQGFLPKADQLDSEAFVPPAPAADSALQAMDTAWSQRMLRLRDTPRWDLATSDADLHFPHAAGVFSCTLGIDINEQDTPALYMLLRRTLTDIGLATYTAKNAYQRPRPFMTNGAPICTPQDEAKLRKDGSYPSGHTAVGWGWALLLTELEPDRAEALLARGRAYGESRNVCNVHWYSDVVSGREVGAAAVANLHTNAQFLEAMDAAKEEIDRAREKGLLPTRDCAAEAAALKISL